MFYVVIVNKVPRNFFFKSLNALFKQVQWDVLLVKCNSPCAFCVVTVNFNTNAVPVANITCNYYSVFRYCHMSICYLCGVVLKLPLTCVYTAQNNRVRYISTMASMF